MSDLEFEAGAVEGPAEGPGSGVPLLAQQFLFIFLLFSKKDTGFLTWAVRDFQKPVNKYKPCIMSYTPRTIL